MKCPACNNQLEEMTVDDLTVDVCKNGCGGIWFDNFELEQVDEKHESAGEQLLHIERSPAITVDQAQRRHCPKCAGQIMLQHFMSVKREVAVDECPACGSFWLDAGELSRIRDQYETEADRKRAANEYFDEVFSAGIATMRDESGAKLESAKKIAHLLRFICPSYYIPGKQDWGAF